MDTQELLDQIRSFTVVVGLSDRETLLRKDSDTILMIVDSLSLVYQYASAYLADARIRGTQQTLPEVGLDDIALVLKAVAETQVILLAKLAGQVEAPPWIYDLDDFVGRINKVISLTEE